MHNIRLAYVIQDINLIIIYDIFSIFNRTNFILKYTIHRPTQYHYYFYCLISNHFTHDRPITKTIVIQKAYTISTWAIITLVN